MKYKKYPKVLIVSHNVFSTTSSMGKTMAAFFNGWERENIAQLYFHTESPNSNICKRYFRVTDFDIIEAIFKFKKPGTILDEHDIKMNTSSTRVDTGIKSDIYKAGKKRKPYMYFIRNLIWGTNKWKTKELINWIDDFKPEVVFYAAGDYSFSIKIALAICKLKSIPMVVFFGDDYYLCSTHKGSFLNWFNRKIYKGEFSKMFSYLSCFIAASDKMQRKYSGVFNKPGYVILTSTEVGQMASSHDNIKVSYIGNMGFDRWKPLVEIGKYLKYMGYILDIYSAENRKNVINELNLENGIRFHGAVPSCQVKEIIKSSTIIIHIESMDEINREKTRYSMSTKIAESLGSGVCLFAYGPKDVSSIEYLVENDVACVVTDKYDLQGKLREILNCKELRAKYIKNALNLADRKHNIATNTQLFYKIMTEACMRKEDNIDESITS